MELHGKSRDKVLVSAMNPLFNGLTGQIPDRMKTVNEVKLETLKEIGKNQTNTNVNN